MATTGRYSPSLKCCFLIIHISILISLLPGVRSFLPLKSSKIFPVFTVAKSSLDDDVTVIATGLTQNVTRAYSFKKPQQRRPHVNRRPRNYWTNVSNIEKEVDQFWRELGIQNKYVLIPNRAILSYYKRHDLESAIASQGGRESLQYVFSKETRILPGRWSDALMDYPHLFSNASALSNITSPWNIVIDEQRRRWEHKETRKEKGYWNLTIVFKKLYNYTYNYRRQYNRPSTWMPRPSELLNNGNNDLRQAICRFGGFDYICRRGGMVPYREWVYFEGQLELLLELERYCDDFHAGNYSLFPCVSDVKSNGYNRLYSLIQYYGGRDLLSLRLGMMRQVKKHGPYQVISFGAFDLKLAVKLLLFVRDDQLRKNPPLRNAFIVMPSERKLREQCTDGEWIHDMICAYGGYENVARRLGLAY